MTSDGAVAQLLSDATQRLRACSASPRLDAELLLAHVMAVPRSFLYAHPEATLKTHDHKTWQALLVRRLAGEPVAYLLGTWSFGDLDFEVNQHTLVPRPETECLVAHVLANCDATAPLRVVDVGTGSGAIACVLAKARPTWFVEASEFSEDALAVARRNAKRLGLPKLRLLHRDLLSGVAPASVDVVVSNPPYVASDDPALAGDGVRHEPRMALVAADQGRAILASLIHQASGCLKAGGSLVVEHGADQGAWVRDAMRAASFTAVGTQGDLAGHPRITFGTRSVASSSLFS